MIRNLNIVITGPYPPGVVHSAINDKTYAVSGSCWIEVPSDVTTQELLQYWVGIKSKPKTKYEDKVFTIPSSKPNHPPYQVSLKNDWWSCTCVGFGFHKNCSHIKRAKTENGYI